MIKYKTYLKNIKKVNAENDTIFLPTGENWRDYFNSQVLTDNEYIVYYNINNINYLYKKYFDINSTIGDLSDLDNPIDNTSIVNAINYVWENGSAGTLQDTIDVNATDPENEGGENQSIINQLNKSSIDTINDAIVDLNDIVSLDDLVDPIPKTSVADAINYVYQNGSDGENTTDFVIPVDASNEGGETQQIINQNNKSSIDNLNTEVNNIINGTTPIVTDTSNVNTINSELENGSTQQEVNQNNKESIDTINDEITQINQDIVDINNNLPDLTNYYTKAEVDVLISDLQSQINACCGGSNPNALITNVIPEDTTIIDGTDGTITFDVFIENFVGQGTAVLNPVSGSTTINLIDGDNLNLVFENLTAQTYTIEIYDGSTLITSQQDIIVNDPIPSGNDFIPLTPESDDGNSKTNGEIVDSYLNYDIILSKNQHPEYVGNGLFIGKEIDINDVNQSGITGNNDIQNVIFTDTTNFNTNIVGSDFTGIYYLKGINVGLTPLIVEGIYENNDSFSWITDITQFNMIIQKWWDNARNVFSYTLWEQTTTPEQNYIYVAKNAADTALDGWRLSNQEVSTGIGEGSYLAMLYGFNFTTIDNIVTSQTSNTYTLNDYASYDLLLFKIEGSNFAVGDWVIKVSDIVADGTTKHSYANYQQEHFTINGNVLTWTSGGGLGHLELVGVKGIKL